MNIEKLQMCRLCLVEDVRMFNVTNKDLQTLYEKLTDVPFLTEDSRPMLACVFCYTRLKQCCQLQRKCLEAEKMLTEMVNKDHETKPQRDKESLEYFNGYVISSTEHVNCVLVECQSESNDIKEEFPDDCEEHNDINEIKEEHQTEFEYQDSCPDLEDMTTNHSESDSEDDTPVLEFFKEEETDVSENKRRAEETQSAPDALKKELYVRITRLEDTTTAQHKKTERNTQRRTTTACSKMLNVNNTAIVTKKGAPDALKKELYVKITRLEDTTTAQYKNTERNTQKRKTTDSSKLFKVNNTATPTKTRKQRYECDVCQRSYTIKSKLINHIGIHTGEKPYKREICHKNFNGKQDLKVHYRIHTGEKPFKCEICDKSFSRKKGLKVHFRTHSGEKPYKCAICHKSFSHSHHLKEHNRIHSGEKPYKCETCQKSFNQLKLLKSHNLIHTGEKPFKCEICLKRFKEKRRLNEHFRLHSGEKSYKCKICQRSFALIGTLIVHARIHTGAKPYECEICKHAFAHRNNLIVHNRIHTGEKPYKCEICQKSFNQSQNFKNHKRIHTGEEP